MSRRLPAAAALALAIATAVLGILPSGCRDGDPSRMLGSLPVPTKDDVALVDGRPLTIAAVTTIKDQLARPSIDSAVWAGTAMMLLQAEGERQGTPLDPASALVIARHALGDLPAGTTLALPAWLTRDGTPLPSAEVRRFVDSRSQTAVIQRNERTIAGLR